jgi:hypothetical protein
MVDSLDNRYGPNTYLGCFLPSGKVSHNYNIGLLIDNGSEIVNHNFIWDSNVHAMFFPFIQVTGCKILNISCSVTENFKCYYPPEVIFFVCQGQNFDLTKLTYLCRGFPDKYNPLLYPDYNDRKHFYDTENVVETYAGPIVGSDFIVTVPVNEVWKLLLCCCHFDTNLNVANRYMYVNAVDPMTSVVLFGSNTTPIVALDHILGILSPTSQPNISYPGFRESSFNSVPLRGNTVINFGLLNIDAGDSISNILIRYQKKVV